MLRRALLAALAAAAGASQQSKPASARFVVIAPERFAAALAPYIEAKRKDLPTELVTLEVALKAGGAASDDAERLKRYLWEAWRANGVRYALLVGDADCLPVRYMVLDRVTAEAANVAFYPCDLYYADVAKPDGSFDDWNAEKEGFHARYVGEVRGEANKSGSHQLRRGRLPTRDRRGALAVSDRPRRPRRLPRKRSRTTRRSARRGRGAARGAGGDRWLGGLQGVHGRAREGAPGGVERGEALFGERRASRRTPHIRAARRRGGAPPPRRPWLRRWLGRGLLVEGHRTPEEWGAPAGRDVGRLFDGALRHSSPYEAYLDADGVEHKGTTQGEKFDAPPPPPHCYQTGKYNLSGLGEKMLRAPNGGAVAYIGCNTGSQPAALTLMKGFTAALGRAGSRTRASAICGLRASPIISTRSTSPI